MLAFLISCYGDGITRCGTIACPIDRVCDGHGGCALPAQLEQCAAQNDGAPCSYPGVADGECSAKLCVPAGCGNGLETDSEVCDDGNTQNGDGCSADCTSLEVCGNAITDVAKGEQCDSGDHCRANCTVKLCGDGILDQPLEACDDGAANSSTTPNACRSNCQLARCGDAVLDTGELCDDGNVQSGDGCAADCSSDESCGNLVIDAGEQCDGGDSNANSADTCRADCTLPRCGDNIVDSIEGCDDGDDNGMAPGACRHNCQPARCGDSIVDPDEVCDDGNNVSGDDCSGDCMSMEVCGDGILNIESGETCDCGTNALNSPANCKGAINSSDATSPCRADCTLRRCGDGILEVPEQCEGGDLGGGSCQQLGFYSGTLTCTDFCTFNTSACSGRCGDNTRSNGEQCDGDALGNATCESLGFYDGTLKCNGVCAYDTSDCTGKCGDSEINGAEQCDGNAFGTTTCQSLGFYGGTLSCTAACTLFSGGCSGFCGDGTINGVEQCDKFALNGTECEDFPGLSGGDVVKCDPECRFDTRLCMKCGDGRCDRDRGESCLTCPDDCDQGPCCGNGICEQPDETKVNCSADCQ